MWVVLYVYKFLVVFKKQEVGMWPQVKERDDGKNLGIKNGVYENVVAHAWNP